MKKYWIPFHTCNSLVSFRVLSWVGSRIYQKAPPIPAKVLLKMAKLFLLRTIFKPGKMFGRLWAEWNLALFGDTEVM